MCDHTHSDVSCFITGFRLLLLVTAVFTTLLPSPDFYLLLKHEMIALDQFPSQGSLGGLLQF